MYEDDWLESFYEDKSSDDFYTYNSRDFDEKADFDVYEFDEDEKDFLDERDLAEL